MTLTVARDRARPWVGRAAAVVGLLLIVLALVALLRTGPDVTQYAAERPMLDLQRFFIGRTQAWGLFQDRSGAVRRRFTVRIDGQGGGDSLQLDEHFDDSDGTQQQRRWQLRRSADGLWHGSAADVVGEAIGQISGNALHWQYTLRQPVGTTTYDLAFDDWMYLMDDNTLVNRTRVSKFGVELGQVTLFFRRLD